MKKIIEFTGENTYAVFESDVPRKDNYNLIKQGSRITIDLSKEEAQAIVVVFNGHDELVEELGFAQEVLC